MFCSRLYTVAALAVASVSGTVVHANSVPDGIYDLVVAGEPAGIAVVEGGRFLRELVRVGSCSVSEATGTVHGGRLLINIPDNCMATQVYDMRSNQGALKFTDSNSAYLNASVSTTDAENPSVNLAAGVYIKHHYIYSDAYLDTLNNNYSRGQSRVGRDIPEMHSRATVGDVTPDVGSGLLSGKQLGGFHFSRNWVQDPDRAATVYYTNSHRLRLSSRSSIEFYRDGQIIDRRELQAGEYDIRNLPAAAYSSVLKLRVTDAYGAVTEIDVEVINPPRLLSKGTLDYNVAAGLERIGFKEQGEYRKITGGGYIGYGFTDWLSLFASVYGKEVAGTASIATLVGLISGEMQLDIIEDYRVAYSYSWRNMSLNAEYRQSGGTEAANINASLGLDRYGSLTARFIKGQQQTYGLNYSLSLPWSMSTLATVDVARTGEIGYSAGLTKQWAKRLSTQVTYTKGLDRSDTVVAQLTFSLDRAKLASVGLRANSVTRDGIANIQATTEGRYGIYGNVTTFVAQKAMPSTTATVAAAIGCVSGTCRVGEPISGGFAVGDNLQANGQSGSIIPIPAYNNTLLTASTRTAIENVVVATREGQGVRLTIVDKVSVQGMVYIDGKPASMVPVVWEGGETITGEDGFIWLDRMPKKPTAVAVGGNRLLLMLDRDANEYGIIDIGRVSIGSGTKSASAQYIKEEL